MFAAAIGIYPFCYHTRTRRTKGEQLDNSTRVFFPSPIPMLATTSNTAETSMTMDLLCHETETFKDHHHVERPQSMHFEPQVNTACADPTFLSERCLENLLKSEESNINLNFYNNPHCAITPKRRRIIAEWMMQVSTIFFYFYNYFVFWTIILSNCSNKIGDKFLNFPTAKQHRSKGSRLDYAIGSTFFTFNFRFLAGRHSPNKYTGNQPANLSDCHYSFPISRCSVCFVYYNLSSPIFDFVLTQTVRPKTREQETARKKKT